MKSPQIGHPLKDSYLLIGEETFLIEEQLSAVRALMGEGSSMNTASYHAQEIRRIEEIISLCNTLPFLSDRRLIIIRNIHKLLSKDLDGVLAYLRNPCGSTTLILTIEGVREEKKVMKKLAPGLEILHFDSFKGKDLIDWILSRARVCRKTMDKDAAYLLAEATGGNIWFISSEIEKISLFIGNRPSITIHDVEHLVMRSGEPPVFAFLDSLFDKKKDVAYKLCELEGAGIAELEVVSRIEKQAVLHYQILCTGRSKGADVHPYVEKKIVSRKSLWSARQLLSLLGQMRRVEQAIKSGRSLHPYAAVHEAILGVVFPA